MEAAAEESSFSSSVSNEKTHSRCRNPLQEVAGPRPLISSLTHQALPRNPSSKQNNKTRILAFKNKPLARVDGVFQEVCTDHVSSNQTKSVRQRRYIPQSAERTLDAPDLVDDYYLNLLDWGSTNVLTIALGNTVYLWDATDGSTSELITVDEDNGPVTSVSWAPDGRHIAIGKF